MARTTSVTIGSQLDDFVRKLIESGRYVSLLNFKCLKNMKIIVMALLSTLLITSSNNSMADELDKKLGFHSATKWRLMYFLGTSSSNPQNITFDPIKTFSLLESVGIQTYISTGVPLEPKYLINRKGINAWMMMFFFVYAEDKELLEAIHKGRKKVHVPDNLLRENLGNHINWPQILLKKYDLSLENRHVFVLPFLVSKYANSLDDLENFTVIKDKDMEIIAVLELDDLDPEISLREMHKAISKFR